jgi:hypothetical protein
MRIPVLLGLSALALAASCTTLTVNKDAEQVTNEFTHTQVNGYSVYHVPLYIMLEWKSVESINLTITNPSSKPVKIQWRNSSITINGQTDSIMITGQKFADKNSPMPDLTLPANGTTTRDILPSSSARWTDHGWTVGTLSSRKGDEVRVLLSMEVDGVEKTIELTSLVPLNSGFGLWFVD